MQPANGTGYYPVTGAETENYVPYGPTHGGGKEAAEPTDTPTLAAGASADEPATVDSEHHGSTRSRVDMEGMDSSMTESSTMSDPSAPDPQSTASSESLAEPSQSASNVQTPPAEPQSATGSEPSLATQTTADSQSTQSSQPSAASPGSGSDSAVSTLTTAIVAPTQVIDQSGAPTGTADGGEKSADGHAQSFDAVPRAVVWGSYDDPSRLIWTQASEKSYAVYQETVTRDGKTSTRTMTVWRWPNALAG